MIQNSKSNRTIIIKSFPTGNPRVGSVWLFAVIRDLNKIFYILGICVRNNPNQNVFIICAPANGMGLLSVAPVFLKYKNTPEFTRNAYWTRSDKLASISGTVYGMIPLHLVGSHKLKSLRVTGSNPGGTCHVSIWENFASTGIPRKSIVAATPNGNPFDITAIPAGGYYVTNPTDYNYAVYAYASGDGIDISLSNIEMEVAPIG
jgi:hypothetical protein